MSDAILSTERLRLRPFAAGDVDALHAQWTHPDVRRYLWDGRVIAREEVVGVIEESIASFADRRYGFWVLESSGAPAVAGFGGLRAIPDGTDIELYYGLDRNYWGRGFATEAARGHPALRLRRGGARSDLDPHRRAERGLGRGDEAPRCDVRAHRPDRGVRHDDRLCHAAWRVDGRVMDEAQLRLKLERIEALFAGAATAGERTAAGEAKERILSRLRAMAQDSPPTEYRFSIADPWARKLFLALLRRYDLRPYRYPGQRYTTVMVKVPKRFVDETLWPEFEQLSATLRGYLEEVTDRVVRESLHADSSEAAETAAPQVLGGKAPT